MTMTLRVARSLSIAVLLSLSVACTSLGSGNPQNARPDLDRARVVVMVKFRSELDAQEIRRRYPERMPAFRALPGLVQKFYLYDERNEEWAGIYLWDSAEAVQAYLASDLRKSIPEAYGVVGTPRVESYRLEGLLR